ncbi:MAG: methyl-accepting chemotaxis protein [Devosia sp.]|nr:methyl-accepting chemotaxis protein [Devosia sp.]
MPDAAVRRMADPKVDRGDTDLGEIAARIGGLGVEIADLSGLVGDLAAIGATQAKAAGAAMSAARSMRATSTSLSASMQHARDAAAHTREVLSQSAGEIGSVVERTASTLKTLSDGAVDIRTSLGSVEATLRNVQAASSAIQKVAQETKLLALNASVEAARAGDAGRGFAVIAVAVKDLADQVRNFSAQNQANLVELTETLTSLLRVATTNADAAHAAMDEAQAAGRTSDTLHRLVESAGGLADDIDAMTQPVERTIDAVAGMQTELEQLVDTVGDAQAKLGTAAKRSESILEISEDSLRLVAESGVETPDTPIIALCRDKAAIVGALFERAITDGQLTMAQLFDEHYRPVPGSDPAQVTTECLAFTDRYLPAIQEPVLGFDRRITFCAAVDRNGYLPTHNLVYSKPQGDDPVWNAANCRNHRIFNDRTGLAAGRNTRPFLLQTYRRDMGGGVFALMKDCSAPIFVRGRHWGGLRIAFKV